jgi:acetate kinase
VPGSILTLNAGSSSVKFALFDSDSLAPTVRGAVTNMDGSPRLEARTRDPLAPAARLWEAQTPFEDVLRNLIDFAREHAGHDGLAAAGHRIVHGGPDHVAPVLVTPQLMEELDALTPLDPLHMPRNLALLRSVADALPALPQIACFDTAFHHDMPAAAQAVALPAAIRGKTIRRYGFHGLSYEYIARQLVATAPVIADGRVIVAHLGAGASLCAMQGGRSIATTMGFSVLDGLMMATRCGSIDPGVILYLGRQGHSFAEIEDMLYHRSGLLGLSGISGDMRVLLASETLQARAAIDLFAYRIAVEIGGLVSALGGIDALVFTAGIGAHSPAIRKAVCARLKWLGLHMDSAANENGAAVIAAKDSKIDVRVIATDEEAMIAHHAQAILHAQARPMATAHG